MNESIKNAVVRKRIVLDMADDGDLFNMKIKNRRGPRTDSTDHQHWTGYLTIPVALFS